MSLHQFYTDRKSKHEAQLNEVNSKLFRTSMLRLIVFVAVAFSVYFFWGQVSTLTSILVGGAVLFGILIWRYNQLDRIKNQLTQLIFVNQTELNGLNRNYEGIADGEEYLSGNHAYNQDIDLFGEGSIFQSINRTQTKYGEKFLADWLNANNIENIQGRQEAIKELADKTDWRETYRATLSVGEKASEIDSRVILNWMKNYKRFVPKFFQFFPFVFGVLSIAGIVAYALELIPEMWLLYWLLIGLGITGVFVKRVTSLYNSISQIKDKFANYANVIDLIDNESFSASLLRENKEKIGNEVENASVLLRKLSKEIDQLGNRNNILMAPILNGFFLWDLFFALRIEKWILSFDSSVVKWFEAIEFFDAFESLGNYGFNHPNHVYAELTDKQSELLTADNICHPLMKPDQCVSNSLSMGDNDFIIVTGANMAGKSTFLRTVSLSIVMSNCGLPVLAKAFKYRPIKLISSMRTSDSLLDDASYFYAELTRLKQIVDALQSEHYFVVLDEILKGTNSKDKAEGSAKFVEKLVASGSNGLIATHDLSLCTLADKFEEIRNHYFDAQIVDDELYFDYKFKNGVCQNMNASFLLKKMGIV